MSLELQLDQDIPEGFEDLIENTVWGTENGTRYIQTNFRERLKKLSDPHFIYLRHRDRLLATINLCGANPETQGSDLVAFYVRYFSFYAGYQVKTSVKRRNSVNSAFTDKVKQLFDKGSLHGDGKKALFYAFVEAGNQRSQDMVKRFNFAVVRRFETTIFSRFNPKLRTGFRQLHSEELPEMRRLLQEFYQGFTFYKSVRLSAESYYVFEIQGRIVAGVQALPARWIIKELPGLSGKIIMSTVHRIPYLRRIFNPKNYEFLGLDQVYYKTGAEKHLASLFESTCKYLGFYSALLWSDTGSKMNKTLKKLPLGPMNLLKRDVPVDIIANFGNLSTLEQDIFKKYPAYIDAFDLT